MVSKLNRRGLTVRVISPPKSEIKEARSGLIGSFRPTKRMGSTGSRKFRTVRKSATWSLPLTQDEEFQILTNVARRRPPRIRMLIKLSNENKPTSQKEIDEVLDWYEFEKSQIKSEREKRASYNLHRHQTIEDPTQW